MEGRFVANVNDPILPVIRIFPEIPTINPAPNYQVNGYTGTQGVVGSLEYQACQVNLFISTTIGYLQQFFPRPIAGWSSTNSLLVYPRAGIQLNAYYDRQTLRFFQQQHPVSRKMVYLCESMDVVCHELGHAILDYYRTDLWNNPIIEVAAFHEAFGDCCAILSSLSNPEIVDFIISSTNGDLKQGNSVAKIAEEMGNTLFHMSKPETCRSSEYLRNANNSFTYVKPSEVPNTAPDNQLSRSSHSFSRVFTGAFYDILVNLYESFCDNISRSEALGKARDYLAFIFCHSVCESPVTPDFFASVAHTMLRRDALNGKLGQQQMLRSFINKHILTTEDIPFTFGGTMYEEALIPNVIKLSDHDVVGDNPLYCVEVELPSIRSMDEANDEIIQAAKEALDHLHDCGKVDISGGEEFSEFRVQNGKLVRNYFSMY